MMSHVVFRSQFRRGLVKNDLKACLKLLSEAIFKEKKLSNLLTDLDKLRFLELSTGTSNASGRKDIGGMKERREKIDEVETENPFGATAVDFDSLKIPLSVFHSLEAQNLKIASVLVRQCIQAFRPEQAEMVLRKVVASQSGRTCDAVNKKGNRESANKHSKTEAALYSQVLTGYAILGDYKNVERLFEEINSLYLVDKYCVAALFAALDRSSVGTNNDVVGDVVGDCSGNIDVTADSDNASNMEVAEHFFQKFTCEKRVGGSRTFDSGMDETEGKIPRDTVLYSSMLSICEKYGNLGRAMAILQEMQLNGVERDIIVYNATLACLARSVTVFGDDSSALQCAGSVRDYLQTNLIMLLDQMEKEDVSPTAVTLNAAVRACEVSKQSDLGLQIVSQYFMKHIVFEDEKPTKQAHYSPFASARPNIITSRIVKQVCERLEKAENAVAPVENDRSPEEIGASAEDSVAAEDSTRTPNGVNFPAVFTTSDVWNDALHQLIEDSIAPSSYETDEVVNATIARFHSIVTKMGNNINTDLHLEPYGSLVSNTAARGADVDLTLVTRDSHVHFQNPEQHGSSHLHKSRRAQQTLLLSVLREELPDGVRLLQAGLGGRIPVLSMEMSGFDDGKTRCVDLTIHNWHGVQKTRFIKEEIERTANRTAEQTAFGPFGKDGIKDAASSLTHILSDLIRLVKYWAKQRTVCGQTNGFLGGYSWTLLVLFFLRERKVTSDISMDKVSLDVLFCDFFRFYAYDFDWKGTRIQFHATGKDVNDTQNASMRNQSRKKGFHLYDPIEMDWNLGSILNEERLLLTQNEIAQTFQFLTNTPTIQKVFVGV